MREKEINKLQQPIKPRQINQNIMQPPKKKRRLKKKVKRVLYLFCACILIFSFISLRNQKEKRYTEAQRQIKMHQSSKQKSKNLIQSYGETTRNLLKKSKRNPYLILQTDERWTNIQYGWGEFQTLGKNGCAIASLAMIQSYWNKKIISPKIILKWSHEDYFTDSGTSWSIFPSFAEQYGYQFRDLSDRLYNAIPYLKRGIPVIASINVGRFTDVGHVLVLSKADNNHVWLLDPNDNAKKRHSLTAFTYDEIQHELAHLWVFIK